MWHRAAICGAVAVALAGCQGSRWARDDIDYARKYPRHTDNVLKMAKQAADARHVRTKHGYYAGFAGRDEPFGAGVEAGLFAYPTSWIDTRIGGALLGHDGPDPVSGGGVAGIRVQPPTRLAPFVGLGGYAGWTGFRDATDDHIDNDDNGFTDELGEQELDFAVSVFPEVGFHYGINGRLRLTGSADYRFASDGRDSDAIFYGLSISLLEAGQHAPPLHRRGDKLADLKFGDDPDGHLVAALPSGAPPVVGPPAVAEAKTPATDDELDTVGAVARVVAGAAFELIDESDNDCE